MLGDLEANRDGKRRWSRVAWAATGLLWAFLFFSGADQVASNTFIDRSSDGSAAPDALFRYVAENPTVIGALLITLAVANILFVLFAAHIANWLGPTVKLRWLPATVVMVAALGTLPFWFADVSTALIWIATATGAASAGYQWISPTIDALVPLGIPVVGVYIGLVAYVLGHGGILPAWVRWFTWGIAVLVVAFGGLAIAAPTTGPGGPLAYVSVVLWTMIISLTAIWSAWRLKGHVPA